MKLLSSNVIRLKAPDYAGFKLKPQPHNNKLASVHLLAYAKLPLSHLRLSAFFINGIDKKAKLDLLVSLFEEVLDTTPTKQTEQDLLDLHIFNYDPLFNTPLNLIMNNRILTQFSRLTVGKAGSWKPHEFPDDVDDLLRRHLAGLLNLVVIMEELIPKQSPLVHSSGFEERLHIVLERIPKHIESMLSQMDSVKAGDFSVIPESESLIPLIGFATHLETSLKLRPSTYVYDKKRFGSPQDPQLWDTIHCNRDPKKFGSSPGWMEGMHTFYGGQLKRYLAIFGYLLVQLDAYLSRLQPLTPEQASLCPYEGSPLLSVLYYLQSGVEAKKYKVPEQRPAIPAKHKQINTISTLPLFIDR